MVTKFLDRFNKEDAQKLSKALSLQHAIMLTKGVNPSFKEEMQDELSTRNKVGVCVDALGLRTTISNKWYRTFNTKINGIEQLSCSVDQTVPDIIEADPSVVFLKLPDPVLNLLLASSLMDSMVVSPIINIDSVESIQSLYRELFLNPDGLKEFSSVEVAQYFKDAYLFLNSRAFAIVPSNEVDVDYRLERVFVRV